jgi:hypothetical protein
MGSDVALDKRAPPCAVAISLISAGRSVQAIHVNDAIHLEVFRDGHVAATGRVFIAEVAFALNIMVQPVGYHRMIPCIVHHSRLICFVINGRVPYLQQ